MVFVKEVGISYDFTGSGSGTEVCSFKVKSDKDAAEIDMKGYEYLYLTDITSDTIWTIFSSGVCVKECPTEA
jgi:hypothetical protein